MNELISKEEQEIANQIEVVFELPEGCEINRACDPEELFELVEQCKICGRCI